MKIFISWSGKLSQLVAILLREWLRNVIQVVEPYVSSEDIEKGARWFADIDSKLDKSDFGIVCLTHENMTKPWILFEAGAISRSINRSRVTPLLIDLSPADLEGPLSQFQATTFTETDMLRLVKDIGSYLGDTRFDGALLEQSFKKWWPDLQQAVFQVIESAKGNEPQAEHRPNREILEELVQLTRNIAQFISSPSSSVIEIPKASDSLDFERIKDELEKRRKIFLVTVLEGASRASLEGDELYLEFAPNAKHLRDTIAKSDNIKILRDVVSIITGRDIGIRIVLKEGSISESLRLLSQQGEEHSDNRLLREMAHENPMVQQMLRTFRGDIKEVRPIEEE